jgi:hypothetical protein
VEYIGEHAAAVLSDIKHHLCEASAFSGAPSNVKCDGCIRQKQDARLLFSDGKYVNPHAG